MRGFRAAVCVFVNVGTPEALLNKNPPSFLFLCDVFLKLMDSQMRVKTAVSCSRVA